MTRSIFALLITMFITLGAQFAYAQPGRGMDPEQQLIELIAALEITAEQEPAFRAAMMKVNELRMAQMEQMRGMRGDQGQGQSRGQGQGQGQGRGQDADGAHDGHGAGNDQSSADAGEAGRGMEMMAQRRAEMAAKTKVILEPVLSGAQMTKYNELEAERMEQMMSRMRRQ